MGNIRDRYSEEELEEMKNNKEKGLEDWFGWVLNLGSGEMKDFSLGQKYLSKDEGVRLITDHFEGTPLHGYRASSKEKGVKLSSDKPPMAQLFKQFPLAFEQLALRSKIGHEKYIETDKDWMNWKRVPNAIFEYEQAKARHMLKIGEDTDFEHLIAEAWNMMAIIQLKLEK